ncbi:MAG: ketopantoate reductase family protein [Bacillota bacterium]|nr:ketopantoate reductase family protein [Bacillota bacterium]
MKILIYGSGAVGLGVAAAIYDGGLDIDLIARGKTKEAVISNGIIRKGIFKEIFVPADEINVYENLSQVNGRYDFVLVCTKTTGTSEASDELYKYSDILEKDGKIVIFQNGFGNDEPFLNHFSKDKIYSARVITGFSRPERNISLVTVHSAPILIGSLYGNNLKAVEPLANAINKGGIPCETNTEVSKALWAKMIYNCTLNPLGAILNVAYGKLTKSESSVFIMNKIIDEIFAVINAAGYETYWKDSESYKEVFYNEILPPTYNHRSSTLQDIERKIKTEIDSLNGYVIKLAKKYNVDVPYNIMIYNMIKAKESYF